MFVEKLFSHFGFEQIHACFEVGGDTVDDGNVVLDFVVHDVKVLQTCLQHVFFKVVATVRKGVVHKGDKQVFFDEIDVEIAKLLARVACNRIANVGDTVVFVGGDDEFSLR